MAGGAGEDEQVPGKMAIAKPLVREKNQTRGVGDAAGEEPDHSGRRNRQDELTEGEQDQPAHSEIQKKGQLFPANAGAQFERHADKSEEPDESEDCPTESTAHRTERERRIRSGDEQKDRGVIDDLERALEARLRPGVIKRRAEIEQPHRCDENDRADEERLARLARRCDAKKRCGDACPGQTEPMAHAVGDFFAPGLVPVRRREKFVDRFHALRERS